MFPKLISVGPLTIYTYGFFVAIGFLSGLLITIKIGKSRGIAAPQIMDMGFLIILSALIGSRLLYVFLNFAHYIENPLSILKIWQGGLIFSGGVLCVVLVMGWYITKNKLSFWEVGDIWAPAAAIGQGIGRIGCLMAGCCYGSSTDRFWGVVFTDPNSLAPLNVSLHPTQIYSAGAGFIIFSILLIINSKKTYKGQVLLWFLILHSTARLVIERFRGDNRGVIFYDEMSITQFLTILILVASAVILIVIKQKKKDQNNTA